MKGFIELTVTGLNRDNWKGNNYHTLININEITRVMPYQGGSVIIIKELVSKHECSNENLELECKQSFEEVIRLIKQATEI